MVRQYLLDITTYYHHIGFGLTVKWIIGLLAKPPYWAIGLNGYMVECYYITITIQWILLYYHHIQWIYSMDIWLIYG